MYPGTGRGKVSALEHKRRRVDIVSDPSFVADIEQVPLAELRNRRKMCDDLDAELSYYRRVLHGRLDLLAFELRRRSGEESRTLMEALPEILSDTDEPAPSDPSLRSMPIELPYMGSRQRAIDRALDDDFLTHLPTVEDDELRAIESDLASIEAEISAQRRAVYDALEAILEELTRRYRDGLASVDELLPQG